MSTFPNFRAIILDMDGLMVDTERLYIHANQTIASSYGKTVTDSTLIKMMGRATLESLDIFAAHLQLPSLHAVHTHLATQSRVTE